jgi:hypothetical protein
LALAALFALLLAGIFYVPFVLRPGTESVALYLRDRVVAGLGWATFSQTGLLLGLYLPPFYLPVIVALTTVGATIALRPAAQPFGPVIVAWFAAAFAFYMLLGGEPRSHIYMYVLPGMILAALTVDAILSRAKAVWSARAAHGAAWVLLLVSSAMTWYMLVDHSPEHPWERKAILGYELPNLVTQDVQGVLGFPYRRGLERAGLLFRSGSLDGTFDSNERDATVEYYFGAQRASPPGIYFDESGSSPPDYYVYVLRPFSLRRELPGPIKNTYRLMDTVTLGGRTAIEIYAAPWKEP